MEVGIEEKHHMIHIENHHIYICMGMEEVWISEWW
jgi:hypothetical protein